MMKYLKPLVLASVFVLAFASMGFAATDSNILTVPLTATVNESLSIVNNTPGTVDFGAVAPNASKTSGTLSFTEKWVLTMAHTDVYLYAYFATDTNADLMSGAASATTTIPYSAFQATPQSGSPTTFAALPAVSATAYGVQIADHAAVAPVNMGTGTTDQFTLTLNMPATQPADTYNGTLTVRAQTN